MKFYISQTRDMSDIKFPIKKLLCDISTRNQKGGTSIRCSSDMRQASPIP